MPDYDEKVSPEKEFFFPIVSTLFPIEMKDIINNARASRSVGEVSDKSELVKLTPEIYEEIHNLLKFPSKFKFKWDFNTATAGKAVHLLKAKAVLKKKRNPLQIREVDFKPILLKRLRARRLQVPGGENAFQRRQTRDEHMEDSEANQEREPDEEEKEEAKE